MTSFNELFYKYTLHYNDRIKKFCEPLQRAYGINHFIHYKVTDSGLSNGFSNHANWMEYFIGEQIYLHCPYMRHPQYYQSGYVFVQNEDDSFDDSFQQAMKMATEQFNTQFCFLFLNKNPHNMEAFVFGAPPTITNMHSVLATEIPLLQLFISRFCEEFDKMLEDLSHHLFDIATPMGLTFHEKADLLPASLLKKRRYLLKQLGIDDRTCALSKREWEIVPLYLKGYSASQIAKQLFLSTRTIENYIDNLKNKLGCFTKRELIEKLTELQQIKHILHLT